jgi:hypothetical protein
VRELQVAPGSVQLALTSLKELPVSAYPDQLVDVTSLRPLKPGDVMPTRWSVGWYPTVSFLISETAIAFASAAAEWVAAGALIVPALATAAVPASRPIAGITAAKE